MPRPQRIQYENAYYHVMNRGRGRQKIFHSDEYYQAFLTTIEEACRRFGLEIQAYCLMSNHYHLYVKTPRANLDRCMRHINGIYTQRYNRLKETDGPLFRGRYKAVIVEADAYGLQLSRYIHRNPIETNKPIVDELESYKWSSYPAYINKIKAPEWLNREFSYSILGKKSRYQAYKTFVEQGIDDETFSFYSAGKLKLALSGKKFIDELRTRKDIDRSRFNTNQELLPSIKEIVNRVSVEFGVNRESIYKTARGRGVINVPRWVSMYLCREVSGHALKNIVDAFNISHISGVNQSVSKLKILCSQDEEIKRMVKLLIQDLTP